MIITIHRRYSCTSEQGVIYSAEIGDSQRVRDGFTEETISALGLQGSRGVYSVDKIGNGF